MKTLDEVNELKWQWCGDPMWDLEKTEGFEEYHDELLEFSNEMKTKWAEQERKRIEKLHDPEVQADEALDLIRFAKRGTEEQANTDILTAIAKLLYVIHVDLDRIVSISDNWNL